MTITIDVTPEIEKQLRDEAAQAGLDTSTYVVNTLRKHLRSSQSARRRLSTAEARLIERINIGLSQEDWKRYHCLIGKRRAERLTPDEHAELIALSDRIEEANVLRLQSLLELAQLRQESLDALMDELGITAPAYV